MPWLRRIRPTLKCLLFLAIFLAAAKPAPAQTQHELTPIVQDQAEKWARALINRDHATMVDFMPERVVTRMGGKDEAVRILKKSSEDMKEKGLGVEEAVLGVPVPPQKIEGLLVSVMTETLTLRTPKAKATQESHLLALSSDLGKTWKFLDLNPLTEDKLYGVFPELKGKFKLPPKSSPVMEKTP